MEDKVNFLLNKIKILKCNDIYRFGDTVFHKGSDWQKCVKIIIKSDKYKNTILRRYFDKCPNRNLTKLLPPKERYRLIKQIVNEKIKEENIELPKNDELVIHLRSGDGEFKNKFKKNYINIINHCKNKYNIKNITIVTVFNFGLKYNEDILLENKEMIKKLLEKIIDIFPNLNINVLSNTNSDIDFIYLLKSKYFVEDYRRFSKLIRYCRGNKNINL